MRYVRSFGLFWWDFIVGDDWRAALAVLLSLPSTRYRILRAPT